MIEAYYSMERSGAPYNSMGRVIQPYIHLIVPYPGHSLFSMNSRRDSRLVQLALETKKRIVGARAMIQCEKGGTLITFMEACPRILGEPYNRRHVTHIDIAASLDLATSLELCKLAL